MANNRDSCGSYLSDEELVIIRLGGRACGPPATNGAEYTVSQILALTRSYSFLAKIKIYLVHNCKGRSEKPYNRKSLIEEQRNSVRALFVVEQTDKYTFSCDTISISLQLQDGIGSRRQQYFSNDF